MKKFRIINNNSNLFPDNRICNMKYRWYSIAVLVFCNQFEYFSNTFFFLISVTQCKEKYAINSPITSLGPWLLVYIIALVKESIDDYKRNIRDYYINNQKYVVYRNKTFRSIRSKDIKVGDFIILEKNQRVPADVVLLKTSDSSGQLFLRTDQLDGETDWKLRSAVSFLQQLTFEEIKNLKILAEEPNKEIYSFNGIASVKEIDTKDLELENPKKSKFKFFNLFEKKKEEEEEIVGEEMFNFIKQTSKISLVINDNINNTNGNINNTNDNINNTYDNINDTYDNMNTNISNDNINTNISNDNINTNNTNISNDNINTNNTNISNDNINNTVKEGLNIENMLWMNTVVATCSALCCVVYTGNDTRAMLNTSKPRNKVGTFDNELNTYSKFLGTTSVILACIFACMKGFSSNGFIAFVRFLVLFSSIIPISLKTTIDMAKYVYAYSIANDDKIPNTIVRNSSIPEELGRISYFLTDKTGTLTKNEMEMKKIHLGTVAFTQESNEEISKNLAKFCSKKNEQLDIFNRNKKDINHKLFELVEGLCLCHNVSPVIEKNTVTYQASSPDEIAIVRWTEAVGMKLFKRDREFITIRDSLNDEQVYEILNIFPFTSETKRMGIIVRKKNDVTNNIKNDVTSENEILFIMKGADVVMSKIIQYTDWVDEETENMARDGLRTLVIGKRVLSKDLYSHFIDEYEKAKSSISNRIGNISKAMEIIETDLTVLGLTGVEDKLQDKVKISLENLRNAGIKIWMLTGDKIETAISIATSSKIFDKTTEYKIISEDDLVSINKDTFKRLDAVVIDGNTLNVVMDRCFTEFIEACLNIKALVGCRFSPTQKALVAKALRLQSKKIVCCIGDGGNDVSMITEADVGIGIVGKEGNQASLAADFSVEKFCYVMDLFFWHGRNSYRNSVSLTYLVIHRGTILSVLQGLFCALINFIPFNIYHGGMLIAFISCYTFFPIFSTVFSLDVSREVADMFPELYKELVEQPLLTVGDFSLWNFMSFYQGTIIMSIMVYRFKRELFSISTLTFTSLIINEILMVFLTTPRISKYTVIACFTSLIIYFISFFIFTNIFYINMGFFKFLREVLIANGIAIFPKLLTKGFKFLKPSSSSKLESKV